jgi:hypothetical protein
LVFRLAIRMRQNFLHIQIISALLFGLLPAVFGLSALQAQGTNFSDLFKHVEEGKTYAVSKSKNTPDKKYEEREGYQIRLVPSVYRTVYDTIVISPALNGNLDTSNYFIQTEILVLREPGTEWKKVTVSRLCMKDVQSPPHAAICLLKTTPKYEMVNRKFFPFKNILDTTRTDNVVPAEILVFPREELVSPARLEKLSINEKTLPTDRIIKITPGSWGAWEEVVCPYGVFNDPDIRQVQTELQKRGYDVKITNNYDEQTKRALHEFQNDNVLKLGEFDDETLKRLGIERQKLIQIED